MQANRTHISRRDITPPGEGRWQGLPDLTRSKSQQPMPAATLKGIGQPPRQLAINDRRLVSVREEEMAMGCQAQLETRHGCRANSKKVSNRDARSTMAPWF